MAQLLAKIPSGQTVTIDIDEKDVIQDIKRKIQDKTAIPSTEQILHINGRIMSKCHIIHEKMVDVLLPIKGGWMQMYGFFFCSILNHTNQYYFKYTASSKTPSARTSP